MIFIMDLTQLKKLTLQCMWHLGTTRKKCKVTIIKDFFKHLMVKSNSKKFERHFNQSSCLPLFSKLFTYFTLFTLYVIGNLSLSLSLFRFTTAYLLLLFSTLFIQQQCLYTSFFIVSNTENYSTITPFYFHRRAHIYNQNFVAQTLKV